MEKFINEIVKKNSDIFMRGFIAGALSVVLVLVYCQLMN